MFFSVSCISMAAIKKKEILRSWLLLASLCLCVFRAGAEGDKSGDRNIYKPAVPTPFVLPNEAYATVGSQFSIVTDNLIYSPVTNLVLFNERSGPGAQFNEAITWMPRKEDIGSHRIVIDVNSGIDFSLLAESSINVFVTDPSAITSRGKIRWLAIGDSLSLTGWYISKVATLFKNTLPSVEIEPIGTQHPPGTTGPISHEARGGWTWRKYLTAYSLTPDDKATPCSPFVYGANLENDFDFKRYVSERCGGNPPNIVTISLGPNDVFGISEDFSEEKVAEIIGFASKLVEKIRSASPNTVVGIIPPNPPSDQDGFGANYGGGVTAWQYRRALQAYIAQLQKKFEKREGERIYYVPCHLAFHSAEVYPKGSDGRTSNALHYLNGGYDTVGVELFSWFAYLLTVKAVSPTQ